MDRFTPAPSFRPTRPLTRSRNRARPMSPSPRPNPRRPFTESVPSTMFITTDCDFDYISPSSPDLDLVFNMSPIHSHFLPSSSPTREPVNVMTLRNKTQRKTASPPLSPLLYSFPRPSRLHPYMKQNAASPKDISSKPLASISQNLGVPTLDHRVRSASSSRGTEAVGELRPLAASLFDSSFLPPAQEDNQKPIRTSSPPKPSHHRTGTYPSSPIPIPRHTPRQSDPGPFVSVHPPPSLPLSAPLTHNIDNTPLPSSGIASHVADTGFRSAGHSSPHNASPAGSHASSEPIRIEGFDGSECDPHETDREKNAESLTDFRSSAVSSTAYSYSGSGPFRFSSFLDSKSQDSDKTSGVKAKGTLLTPKRLVREKEDSCSH